MSEKLSPERLAEIAARVEAATAGPWTNDSTEVHAESNRGKDGMAWASSGTGIGEMAIKADAAFVAASRDDVPALLAHIAAVEAENARLRTLATVCAGESQCDVGYELCKASNPSADPSDYYYTLSDIEREEWRSTSAIFLRAISAMAAQIFAAALAEPKETT